MTTFQIQLRELKAAMLFASVDESRYVLNSVCVELAPDKQPLLVATDGRRLGVIETEASQTGTLAEKVELLLTPFLIKTLAAMPKPSGKAYSKIPVLTFIVRDPSSPAPTIEAGYVGGDWTFIMGKNATVEGHFPKWRMVVPKSKGQPVETIGLNAQFIGSFLAAAKVLGKDSICQYFGGDEVPTVIEIEGRSNFYGVLMPIRRAQIKTSWQPDFLRVESPVEKPAEPVAA